MTQDAPNGKAKAVTATTPQQFFEDVPPGGDGSFHLPHKFVHAINGVEKYTAVLPDIVLHCEDAACTGRRTFHSDSFLDITTLVTPEFVVYTCRNCRTVSKFFALRVVFVGEVIQAYKVGEFPPFGPPTPARLTSLVGNERDYFFKGRRAESQNMGIAAFAYYRRVIENQRNRIFDAIISVAEKLHSNPEMIADLRAARSETQFSKGVDHIKHGIPEVLLVNGHNPLKLLHAALSEGLHGLSDEDCLELARSIRVVMTELAERLAEAVKNEAELTEAVSKLLKPATPARKSAA